MVEAVGDEERLKLDKRIILFIGPEGAGKSSIAKRLGEEFGVLCISTGSIIRDLKYDRGPLGDECRAMFKAKGYLSGASLLRIVASRFGQEDIANGCILDGGLRTVEETQGFQAMLESVDRAMALTVVHLRIPAWMSFERLVWGPSARKREDDTMEGVLSRLSNFYFQLNERVGIIKKQPNWNLVHIDATGPIDEVYEEVCRKLSLF